MHDAQGGIPLPPLNAADVGDVQPTGICELLLAPKVAVFLWNQWPVSSGIRIQTELRPLIIRYLEEHFASQGYKDAVKKANGSFYWESQEGKYVKGRRKTFGARNYPDFIITDPYLIAIEYKQNENGSTVKQGIGQSIMHTLTGDFDYVYYLFHDQNGDKPN